MPKQPATESPRKIRVACVQYQLRQVRSFAEFERQVSYFADVAGDYEADYVLFPELFTMQLLSATRDLSPREGMLHLTRQTARLKKLFARLARRHGHTMIGGSHPVKVGREIHNIAFVALPDGTLAQQSKLHITPCEQSLWDIAGGHDLAVIDTPKARIGVLICYDVEFPEAARALADQGAEIIFVPYCTDNREGHLRVRYCAQARAVEHQIYLALAGNIGNLPGFQSMDIQYGQAAVLTPSDFGFARDGIAAEADPNHETVLICDLDMDALHRARANGTVTPRLNRRDDLFSVIHHRKG